VDHRKIERRITFLFADRRLDRDSLEFDFQNDLHHLAVVCPHLDTMQTLERCRVHFVHDGVAAITRQPIHASPHQEVRAEIACQTIKLENVALSVSDMDEACGPPEKRDRLPKIVEPAHALFFLDRHAGRINFSLERLGSFELLARPKFHGRQAERQPFCRHGQT